jgi:hypothetical protein
VLKIDVEGAEKLVIDGATGTFRRFRPLLLCEADEYAASIFGCQTSDLIKQVGELAYATRC